MTIAPGTKLSSFEVLEQLGRGGMGEVYRARDTRLNREVALKFLTEMSSADPDRLARFAREAQVLASLNHPHIAAIYGVEEAPGGRCLVLELVEGETLAQRLSRGPLPVAEALQYARQIADALEAAHERGIVHRDLKPGNVCVTPEGAVKVLDFGLAKALEPDEVRVTDLSRSPTLTTPATRLGIVMGTAAYMSPEQARGREVDKRADIWAFGCVLYEMLTGKQAFAGETVSDIMASVLKTEADWKALPKDTPASIRRLLVRCLQREAKARLRDIGEARILLDEVLAGREPAPAVATPLRPAAVPVAGLLAVTLVALALGGVLGWRLSPGDATVIPLRKLEIVLDGMEAREGAVISPDGRRIVYTAEGRLWVRELEQLEPRELRGTDGATYTFWSPDSSYVGYFLQRRLWKVPAQGGAPVLISQAGDFVGGAGATWTEQDEIIFSRGDSGLFLAPAAGGDAQPYLALGEDDADFHEPSALPGGRGFIYVVHRGGGPPDTLAVYDGKNRKELLRVEGSTIWSASYSPTGHIIYQRSGMNTGIWAAPFSLSRLEVVGAPFLVLANASWPSVAGDGTLVCIRGGDSGLLQFVWVERQGKVLETIGQPHLLASGPASVHALSPDGRLLASAVNEGGNVDIWVNDLERGTRTRLTFSPATEFQPAWSPDGRLIAFTRGDGPNIVWRPADGSGQEEILTHGMMPSFSPDGKFLLYMQTGQETRGDIWYLPLEGERKPVKFLATAAQEEQPMISPDGSYMAYVSDESGRQEIYLTRFPSAEGKWQVSAEGGTFPRWNRKGDRLFYRDAGGRLVELEVRTQPSLALGKPRTLFAARQVGVLLEGPLGFAVHADGERFVMIQEAGQAQRSPNLTFIQNWPSQFARKSD